MKTITTITGKVIHGSGYGKQLGFPTANIDRRQYIQNGLKLKFGIYAGFAVLPKGKKHPAGIVIGPRDEKKLPKLEAHILNFTGNLYGKKIALELHTYVRNFHTYKTIHALREQIKKDVAKIIKILKT